MSTTYFTSDLHIGHRLVAGIRGFWEGPGEPGPNSVPDVDSHSRAVADAWSVVRSDDIVWILGDICISDRTWTTALHLLKGLPGRKRLVCGNHDPAAAIHRDAWRARQGFVNEVFETVQDFARVRWNGKNVLLSHYPYAGPGSEGVRGEDGEQVTERYTEFRLTDCGTPLLHGHTHGPEQLHYSAAGTPQIHVGMDAWGMRLVSQHELERLLDMAPLSVKVDPTH